MALLTAFPFRKQTQGGTILRTSMFICFPFIVSGSLLYASGKGPVLPAKGRDLQSLLPAQWKVIEEAEGDLNKDGKADLAAIIEYTGKPAQDSAPPRTIFIALRNAENEYILSAQADRAILLANDGGMMGDPLAGLSINRGSFIVSYYGGSNWRWTEALRFRFQNNEWALIGYTTEWFFIFAEHENSAENESKDYNLLTGDMVHVVGKKPAVRKNIGKKRILLKDFDGETRPDIFK